MKRSTPSSSTSSNCNGMFSPSKTLFSFGFKSSQSPGTSKATPSLSQNLGKSQSNTPLNNPVIAPHSQVESHGEVGAQKRDASCLQGLTPTTDEYDSISLTQTKKQKISSDIDSAPLQSQEATMLNDGSSLTHTLNSLKEVRLFLVRIDQVDTPLHILCELIRTSLIRKGVTDSEFFIMEDGMTLGRKSANSVSQDESKASFDKRTMDIGIPSDERVISREQLDIVRINQPHNISLPIPQQSFTANMRSPLYSFLHQAQTQLPTMKIRVNQAAKNSIRIHKRRISSNLSTMIQNKEILHKGQESTLSVGDVIVFEASTKIKKNDYIYRLLAMEYTLTASISSPSMKPQKVSIDHPPLALVQQTNNEIPSLPSSAIHISASNQNDNYSTSLQMGSISSEDARFSKEVIASTNHEQYTELNPIAINIATEFSEMLEIKNVDSSNSHRLSATPRMNSSHEQISLRHTKERNKRNQTNSTVQAHCTSGNSSDGNKPDDSRLISSKPTVGDRFRILISVDDCFGRKHDVWHYGSLRSVRKKKKDVYNLDIKLDDTTELNVEYPDKDVERLLSETRIKDMQEPSSIVYALNQEGQPYQVAYDAQPKELFIGDLVLCHFQNGRSNDGWYHGRVAAVDFERMTFDVFYFEGEYEEGVPLVSGNVYLVERGKENLNWIIGLTLPTSFFKPCSENVSSIAIFGPDVIVIHPMEEKEFPLYDDLVRILFLYHRANMKKDTLFRWSVAAHSQSNKRNPYAIYSKTKVHFEPHNWVAGKADDEIDTGLGKSPLNVAEISPIYFANQLWRSINSSQPQIGFGILCYLMEVLHRFPTDMLRSSLQKFIVEGPKNDGVKIRDPNKTELVNRLNHYVADRCLKSSVPCMVYPSSWDDVKLIFNLPMADGLIKVEEWTDVAIRRFLQSIHFANASLNFVSALFLNELEASTDQKCLSRVKELYRSKVLVDFALTNGIRESLKQSLRYFMKCWMEYETFRRNCNSSSCDSHRCLEEYEGCVRSLGAINSSLSWCYCAENGLGYGNKDCCALYRDVIESEMRNSDLRFQEEANVVGMTQKDDLIFRIILSLRTKFSVPLEANLAEMFGLSGAYSLVYDCLLH